MLSELENNLHDSGDVTWSVKLTEKSGKPLKNMFGTKIPILDGCPLETKCKVCEDDSIKCSVKGVVYVAHCNECNTVKRSGGDDILQDPSLDDSNYVGETSRPLRMRANEHWNNLLTLSTDSFMLTHWMRKHGLQMRPPDYKFKVLGCYRDSLSRQVAEAVYIEDRGNMNKRSEFGINHLSRLEATVPDWERDYAMEQEARERANLMSNLSCFKNVILSVYGGRFNNRYTACRSAQSKRARHDVNLVEEDLFGTLLVERGREKRKKMFCSTPVWDHREPKRMDSTLDSEEMSQSSQNASDTTNSTHKTPTMDSRCLTTSAGLTPQLKCMLIHPESEEEHITIKRVLMDTINLTRAAILNGLIVDDLENYMIQIGDNSMYKPFGMNVLNPVVELMQNLDINAWCDDDFSEDQDDRFEILPLDRKRKSVLFDWNIKNSVPVVHKRDEILINPTSSKCTEILISPIGHGLDEILMKTEVNVDEKILIKPITSLSQYVMKMIGRNLDKHKVSGKLSIKRKALSPPGPNQITRAVKLQATGCGSSPDLRIRSGMRKVSVSPPSAGVISSPATGRVKKCRRRIATPKRSYVPDKNQLLITSSFSPKPKIAPNGQ